MGRGHAKLSAWRDLWRHWYWASAPPAALAENQTPTVTLPVTTYPLPYGLNLATSNYGATPMPTLQSFVSGEQNNQWVLIGGRN